MDDISRAIGQRLRDARLSAHLTQKDVATDFLRSRQAVSAWESGRTLPSLHEFRELIVLYGTSADAILYDVDDTDAERASVIRHAQRIAPAALIISEPK